MISLLLFTTLTAMFIAAGGDPSRAPSLGLCLAVGVGFYMAAGAANAINMVLERDLDLRMGRTAKRPTVTSESGRAGIRRNSTPGAAPDRQGNRHQGSDGRRIQARRRKRHSAQSG